MATTKTQQTKPITKFLLILSLSIQGYGTLALAEANFARALGVTSPSVAEAVEDGAQKNQGQTNEYEKKMDLEMSRFLLNAESRNNRGNQNVYRSSQRQVESPADEEMMDVAQKEALAQLEFRQDVEAAMQKILSFQPRQVRDSRRSSGRRVRGALRRSYQARQQMIQKLNGGGKQYLQVEQAYQAPRERLLSSVRSDDLREQRVNPRRVQRVQARRQIQVASKEGYNRSIQRNLLGPTEANLGGNLRFPGEQRQPQSGLRTFKGASQRAAAQGHSVSGHATRDSRSATGEVYYQPAPRRAIRVVSGGEDSESGVSRIGR